MLIGRISLSLAVIAFFPFSAELAFPASAETVTAVCTPKIIASKELVTPAQRKAAGNRAWPPLTDVADGFAWPDTELGVIKADGGYAFFGSDGGYHARQFWEGEYFGNDKYGSVTRTIGTMDNPLGTEPPIDVTIHANPDPSINPFYSKYDYMGGGPVYLVPAGMPGAGKLLIVYHAEIPTIATQSFYSILALASSSDGGFNWTDLGRQPRRLPRRQVLLHLLFRLAGQWNHALGKHRHRSLRGAGHPLLGAQRRLRRPATSRGI
jgi:hypothetical protein